MAPYEVLYVRKCQSPLCWYELEEQNLLGLELIRQTTKQIKKIHSKILAAQSRQKSCADFRKKPLEFQEGEHVFLKITPTIGIGRAFKVKKTKPSLYRSFPNLEANRTNCISSHFTSTSVKSSQCFPCLSTQEVSSWPHAILRTRINTTEGRFNFTPSTDSRQEHQAPLEQSRVISKDSMGKQRHRRLHVGIKVRYEERVPWIILRY